MQLSNPFDPNPDVKDKYFWAIFVSRTQNYDPDYIDTYLTV